jgi:hypothetical protein
MILCYNYDMLKMLKKLFLKIIRTNLWIYILYFASVLFVSGLWILYGIGVSPKGTFGFFEIIKTFPVTVLHTIQYTFWMLIGPITLINLIKFGINCFKNPSNTIITSIESFCVITTLGYLYYIFPSYLSGFVPRFDTSLAYPIVFPVAYALIVWLVFDMIVIFTKNPVNKFKIAKFGITKLLVCLTLVGVIFQSNYSKINQVNSIDTKKITGDFSSNVDKMTYIKDGNVLISGRHYSNGYKENLGGSKNTELLVRNIIDNKIKWTLPDLSVGSYTISEDKLFVYVAVHNEKGSDFGKVNPSNPLRIIKINIENGEKEEILEVNKYFETITNIRSIKINPQNKIIILGYDDKNYSVINVSQKTLISKFPIYNINDQVMLSPKSDKILFIGIRGSKIIELYDIYTSQLLKSVSIDPKYTETKISSNDFEWYLSEGRSYESAGQKYLEKLIINWENNNIDIQKITDLDEEFIKNVTFQSDFNYFAKSKNNLLITKKNNQISIKSKKNNEYKIIKTIDYDGINDSFLIVPETNELLTSDSKGNLYLYNLNKLTTN